MLKELEERETHTEWEDVQGEKTITHELKGPLRADKTLPHSPQETWNKIQNDLEAMLDHSLLGPPLDFREVWVEPEDLYF